MEVVIAVITFVSLVVGIALGWYGKVLSLRAQAQAIAHDKAMTEHEKVSTELDKTGLGHTQADKFWEAYDKRIAILRELGDEEKLKETQREWEQTLQAWQQKQELAGLVPRGLVDADEPQRTPEEAAKVGELLAGTRRLPPTLLTADDYLTRGNAYRWANDYEQALEAYNRALELRPDDPTILNYRGITLRRMGRHEDALKDYNRSVEIWPGHPDALVNRSATLIKLGRCEDAFNDINHALELTPGQHIALYNRACGYSVMGQFEESLRDLEAAIKGHNNNREVARTDEDFEKLRNDPKYGPRFRELVGEQDHSEG